MTAPSTQSGILLTEHCPARRSSEGLLRQAEAVGTGPMKISTNASGRWWLEGCTDPLVAGRLHRRAHRIAVQLRVPRPDGVFDIALTRLAADEVRDPMNPNMNPNGVLQAFIPSGAQCLCNALRDAFGQKDQDVAASNLDKFFECRRNKLNFQEYSVD